jgi:hypothetical protein
MVYSVDSMTTRGASALMLQRRWQLMGALEATDCQRRSVDHSGAAGWM